MYDQSTESLFIRSELYRHLNLSRLIHFDCWDTQDDDRASALIPKK